MRSLWLLTKKNLKLLIRAKSSALIVVFAPLLLILTLGLAFNTSGGYGINVGVYASSFTNEVDSFIVMLEEENFNVVKYEDSLDGCIENIKTGSTHTCILLPSSFSVQDNVKKEVTFYIDPSRINLVWMIQETVKSKFDLKSQQISQDLTNNVLNQLTETGSRIQSEKGRILATTDKNSAAFSDTEKLKAELSNLDFTISESNYDLTLTDKLKTEISGKLSSSKSKISSAKSSVDNSALTDDEKSSIKSSLNSADSLLDDADAFLTSSTSSAGTTVGLNEVKAIIDKLKADLESANNKLNLASNQVVLGVDSLTSISKNINDGIGSLQGLEQTLSEINENIAGQEVTEAGTISNPLITKIKKVSPEGTYLNYTFSAILILVIMFSSLLLGTTLVMMEKNSPAFTRNFFLPIRKASFIFSIYLTNLILITIQIIVILLISLFFLKDSYNSFPTVALIMFLAASVFTFLGMTIGYIFTSEETGVLASISLGSLLLFFSGTILPLETMSSIFRGIVAFNPFVIGENLIREVFIFQSSFDALWVDLLLLLGYAAVLFLVILIIESVLHESLRHKLMGFHHKKHKALQKKKRGA